MELISVERWLDEIACKLETAFGSRLLCLGLQGSYRRGEATEASDIDLVVILDEWQLVDLRIYRQIIASMPEAEKACGFIAGRQQLQHWPKFDLLQLIYDTRLVRGDWFDWLPIISPQDVAEAVQVGAANLYHAACHSFLFESDRTASFPALVKNAGFLLQVVHLQRTQNYLASRRQLFQVLTGVEREILGWSRNLQTGAEWEEDRLEDCLGLLIDWCGQLLQQGRNN